MSLDKEFRDKSWLVSIVTLKCNPSAEQGRRPAGGGVAKWVLLVCNYPASRDQVALFGWGGFAKEM